VADLTRRRVLATVEEAVDHHARADPAAELHQDQVPVGGPAPVFDEGGHGRVVGYGDRDVESAAQL
jgi:hypothetical protein